MANDAPAQDPIAAVEQVVAEFLKRYPPGTNLPPDAFASGPDVIAGETTNQLRRAILRTLGVVTTSVGRGGPGSTTVGALDNSQRVLAAAREALSILQGADGRLTLDSLKTLATNHHLSEDSDTAPGYLLKRLGLAAGVQRAGGLRRIDVFEREVAAEAEAAAAEAAEAPNESKGEVAEKKREHAYYEAFAGVVETWEGQYEASVVGGAQIGRGEWSTPDVVAVSVQPAPSIVVPIVRVATIEVKLVLSRLAIAEALAHKRFAHYAYVGVPQAPGDMDSALLTELTTAGLGLICPRQRGSLALHTYVDARFHHPDEEEVEILLQRFSTKIDGPTMSTRTRDRVRKALAVLLDR